MAQQLAKTKQLDLQKRFNRLQKKFENEPNEFSSNEQQELKNIEKILRQLQTVSEQMDNQKTINRSRTVFNNYDEEWYITLLRMWLMDHPSASQKQKISASGIYKFAVHFFVDNVVLNPKNNHLNYEELVSQLRNVTDPNEQEKKIGYALEDLKLMTSFLTAMQFEVNGQELDSPLRQFREQNVQFLQTDVDPDSELAQVLAEYKQKRSTDKQSLKQNKGQMEWR